MKIAVTPYLMTTSHDISYQLRVTFRHPADYKKGGLDPIFGEELQYLPSIFLDAALLGWPILRPNNPLQSRDLVVVFYINGKIVAYRRQLVQNITRSCIAYQELLL